MTDQRTTVSDHLASALAAAFVVFVLLFAAQGPLQEFIKWIVPALTPDWDELSRKAQRLALKQGPLGGTFQFLKTNFYSKTAVFLGVPLIASLVIVGLMQRHADGTPQRAVRWVLTGCSLLFFGFWFVQVYTRDMSQVIEPETLDLLVFPLAMLLVLYFTMREYGWFIVSFAVFWIFYLFLKGYLPDWLPIFGEGAASNTFAQNYSFAVQAFWVDTGGIFGPPLQVVSRNVLIFIVFGAVLMASGAGDLLLKIANRLTGGMIGGAAHAAVASSAMFGTLSGAAISNVVSTGVMTIPVIKRSGFKPSFAGAVEASASTGGQVVPPVMGVVAFFVAAEIGLDYRFIMIAAITPAVFYYFGVFLTVYFEARKTGIGPLPASERPTLTGREWLQTLVFIIPLGVLTYFLFTQPSIPKAGFYGFIAAILTSAALFPRFRTWGGIYGAFVEAGKMSAKIIIIVAMIGLIIGLLSLSGFTGRLALFLTEIANGPLFFVLIVVALGAIVLGMGLPPGATYFIIVIALSSGIDTVVLAPLTLHLFVVFFAVMSTVTPPVALAAFAAAPIAGADPIRTGWQASRLSIAGFLIPFVFVYHPAVLYKLQVVFEWTTGKAVSHRALVDLSTVSWFDYGWILVAFSVAMWLIASGLIGFERNRLRALERPARVVVGLALLVPNFWISGPALVLAIVLIVGHRFLGGTPPRFDTTIGASSPT